MINISFDDPNMVENFKAIQALRKTGLYTDEQLQKMYDDQVKKDKEAEDEREMENGRELQEMQEGEILQEALHSEKEKKREAVSDGREGGTGGMDGQKVIELNPCPCCGAEAHFAKEAWRPELFHFEIYFYITCSKCSLRTYSNYRYFLEFDINGNLKARKDERQMAADVWNRRADAGKKSAITFFAE